MDGGVLGIGLTLAGAAIVLAGIGYFAGRVAEEVAAAAAIAAGLGLVGLAWLPEPPPAAAPVSLDPVVLSPDRARTEIAVAPAGPPPPLPGREAARIAVEAREAEPNDTLAAANVAALGSAIDGALVQGDRDWFAVDVPPGTRGALVASLVTEDAGVSLALFDDAGQALGLAATLDEIRIRSTSLERRLDRPRFYVRVTPTTEAAARYQLTLAARRR